MSKSFFDKLNGPPTILSNIAPRNVRARLHDTLCKIASERLAMLSREASQFADMALDILCEEFGDELVFAEENMPPTAEQIAAEEAMDEALNEEMHASFLVRNEL